MLFLGSLWVYAAEGYTLGHGYRLYDMLTLGAYFSTEYEATRDEQQFKVEDLAILGYGNLTSSLSYLAELEATDVYVRNFTEDTERTGTTFHVERAYADYKFSDAMQVRAGKMITPIGEWNLEPINVLRDTTSNPLYATEMFPRFLSGLSLYGFVPQADGLQYHLFIQKNRDIDEDYINIRNEHFFGISGSYELDMERSFGASVGEFVTEPHEEKFRFIQLNAKYDAYPYKVTAEGMVRHRENSGGQNAYSSAAYLQGVYRLETVHSFVARYEYFDDTLYDDNILIVGYGYRPLYPVSFKAEYQWHEQSSEDKFLASFSVLF
jgi:hypothetical protein